MDIDWIKRTARKVVEGGQEHVPIVVLDTPRGVTLVAIVISEEDKGLFAPALQALLRKEGATAYALVVEGWMAKSSLDDKDLLNRALKRWGSVRNMPPDDREEILEILEVSERGHIRIHTAIISNTPQGRRLGEFQMCDPSGKGEIAGRMVVKEW